MNYQDEFDQMMTNSVKTLPKAEEVVINPESIAEKMLVRDLPRLYRAKHHKPTPVSDKDRKYAVDAQEAEKRRIIEARIRGEGK